MNYLQTKTEPVRCERNPQDDVVGDRPGVADAELGHGTKAETSVVPRVADEERGREPGSPAPTCLIRPRWKSHSKR